MKILTVSQMQKAERDCAILGVPVDALMENAGKAVAEETRDMLGDLKKQNILVLVGPGNNGGDGLVAARYLYDWGIDRVKIYLCGKRPESDQNFEQIKKRSVHFKEIDNDINLSKFYEWLSEATAVLDAVFGTGKSRPLSGAIALALHSVNEAKKDRHELRVIALDLPSGLNADTGAVDVATPFADNTVTLGFPKVGLFNLPGAERAGKITTVDIGIPSRIVDYVKVDLLTDDFVKSILPSRPGTSHKGHYGKVMAFVGSINYVGAAYLACASSIRVGAGLTTLAIAQRLQPILSAKLTEVTYLPLPESGEGIAQQDAINLFRQKLPEYNVLLTGCGVGQSQPVTDLLDTLLLDHQIELPSVVLDADGINLLSRLPEWWKRFESDAILTPHAGEMSRLLGKSATEIQSNRIAISQRAAAEWHKTVVLKGAYTVVASPDGRVRVSPFANAGLASAGTGDVLAGAIAGIIAQGLTLFDGAACGVYVHALAGEIVKAELGDAGMLASDLLPVLPRAIKQLKSV